MKTFNKNGKLAVDFTATGTTLSRDPLTNRISWLATSTRVFDSTLRVTDRRLYLAHLFIPSSPPLAAPWIYSALLSCADV